MKKVLNGLVLSVKVAGSILGIFAGLFVFVAVVGVVLTELGLENPNHVKMRQVQTAKCEARGGKWVVNPNSYIKHQFFGEGCNLDYQARANR